MSRNDFKSQFIKIRHKYSDDEWLTFREIFLHLTKDNIFGTDHDVKWIRELVQNNKFENFNPDEVLLHDLRAESKRKQEYITKLVNEVEPTKRKLREFEKKLRDHREKLISEMNRFIKETTPCQNNATEKK